MPFVRRHNKLGQTMLLGEVRVRYMDWWLDSFINLDVLFFIGCITLLVVHRKFHEMAWVRIGCVVKLCHRFVGAVDGLVSVEFPDIPNQSKGKKILFKSRFIENVIDRTFFISLSKSQSNVILCKYVIDLWCISNKFIFVSNVLFIIYM